MLVKKKNPEWYPSEKKDIKVGETIEITDPRDLILGGMVIGLAPDGITELTAFELYGEIVGDEKESYRQFLQMQKVQAQQALLEKQSAELKAQVDKKPEEKKEEPKVEPTDKETTVEPVEEDIEKLGYRDLQKRAAAAGLENVVGVSKEDLIKAIKK